jgi:hypothetical protein
MQSCICKTRPTGEYHVARILETVSRKQNRCCEPRDVPAITAPSASNTSTLRFCRGGGSRSTAIFSRIQRSLALAWKLSLSKKVALTRFVCVYCTLYTLESTNMRFFRSARKAANTLRRRAHTIWVTHQRQSLTFLQATSSIPRSAHDVNIGIADEIREITAVRPPRKLQILSMRVPTPRMPVHLLFRFHCGWVNSLPNSLCFSFWKVL